MVLRSSNSRSAHLNDGRASGDGVVGDEVLAAGKDNVGLAGEALGDLDLEATVDGLGLNEGGASDGDEGSVDLASLKSVILDKG